MTTAISAFSLFLATPDRPLDARVHVKRRVTANEYNLVSRMTVMPSIDSYYTSSLLTAMSGQHHHAQFGDRS